ncbi:hypothetical protein C0J52_28207 [Blattella germanica]|nr:hypothetical protein C0J52_28207 [Blattella germanica]
MLTRNLFQGTLPSRTLEQGKKGDFSPPPNQFVRRIMCWNSTWGFTTLDCEFQDDQEKEDDDVAEDCDMLPDSFSSFCRSKYFATFCIKQRH